MSQKYQQVPSRFVQMQQMPRMHVPMMQSGLTSNMSSAPWMYTCPTTGAQYMSETSFSIDLAFLFMNNTA